MIQSHCSLWLLQGASMLPSIMVGRRTVCCPQVPCKHLVFELMYVSPCLQTYRMLLGCLPSPSSASDVIRVPPLGVLRSNCKAAMPHPAAPTC